MPAVLQFGAFRFFLFGNEAKEEPHIHIKNGGDVAKFWLAPVQLASNHGFSARDLKAIEQIISGNQTVLVEFWNGFFKE